MSKNNQSITGKVRALTRGEIGPFYVEARHHGAATQAVSRLKAGKQVGISKRADGCRVDDETFYLVFKKAS